MQLENLRTTKQVSEMLKCTSRNVTRLVKSNKLKPVNVLENGSFLFDVKEIEQFVNLKNGKQ